MSLDLPNQENSIFKAQEQIRQGDFQLAFNTLYDALPQSEKRTGNKNILDIVKKIFDLAVSQLNKGWIKDPINKFRNLTQRTDVAILKEAVEYLYDITKDRMKEVLGDKIKDEFSESGLTGEQMMLLACQNQSSWESRDEVGRCMRFKREV